MKIKTLLIIGIMIIFVFLIYLSTIDTKVYYLNLSDSYSSEEPNYSSYFRDYLNENKKLEKYINEFDIDDYRITDLTRMIEDNKKIKIGDSEQTIKNALIKADLLTFSIGMNDINYKIGNASINELYDYSDEILEDLEILFIILREYCKEDIIMLNYYNIFESKYDEIFNYINDKLDEIASEYGIKVIDLNNIVSNKSIKNKNISTSEHEIISNKLIDMTDF